MKIGGHFHTKGLLRVSSLSIKTFREGIQKLLHLVEEMWNVRSCNTVYDKKVIYIACVITFAMKAKKSILFLCLLIVFSVLSCGCFTLEIHTKVNPDEVEDSNYAE